MRAETALGPQLSLSKFRRLSALLWVRQSPGRGSTGNGQQWEEELCKGRRVVNEYLHVSLSSAQEISVCWQKPALTQGVVSARSLEIQEPTNGQRM